MVVHSVLFPHRVGVKARIDFFGCRSELTVDVPLGQILSRHLRVDDVLNDIGVGDEIWQLNVFYQSPKSNEFTVRSVGEVQRFWRHYDNSFAGPNGR